MMKKQCSSKSSASKKSGLDKLVKASYSDFSNLISLPDCGRTGGQSMDYNSAGQRLRRQQDKNHSDFEKGFIRAETITYDQLVEQLTETSA